MSPETLTQAARQQPDTWTIRRILEWSGPFLKERGFVSGRLDAELMLSDVLACDRLRLYLDIDRPLTVGEKDAFRALLKRRATGEPVAYIRGERDFMGHKFKVTPAVLIPRPDTEVLVEQALLSFAEPPARVLDIGTGSGCVAVSLKKRWQDCYMEAWDLSSEALAVAKDNALSLDAEVTFREVDAHATLRQAPDSTFDLIVSNPPYIAHGDIDLCPGVRAYEPSLALFCSSDGLSFYRLFVETFSRWLVPGGQFLVEVGHTQSEVVAALFKEGDFRDVEIVRDYGGNPRVVRGRQGLRDE